MSNACVLETKVNNAPAQHGTNTVVQNKMLFKAYGVAFPKGTKLIFNGSIIELWKAKLDGPEEGKLIYEGDEALRQLKKLGLEPPEDFDDKARQKP
jgi:hypothetical protein